MNENQEPKPPNPRSFTPRPPEQNAPSKPKRGVQRKSPDAPNFPQPCPEPSEEETDLEPRANEIPPWGTGEKPPSD
ncbi:hypothetical protein WKK05_34285 [Nostoc sp. UHCC 0302]|uniref:hypothetical protein n=1 Tax=Nostoc sp. UHCC 0302 TaxID=3134896 RepID=UPI00311CDC3A